ncbi:MAG: type II secretion system protein GspD [Sphingomonadales bacterium]|nr:MAG: type II secretion system protein GspD [Sphingomonadales bacterium]
MILNPSTASRRVMNVSLLALLTSFGGMQADSSIAQEQSAETPVVDLAPPTDDDVNVTILPGTGAPQQPAVPPKRQPRPGDVTLNFPGGDVQDVAKAVLGGILKLQYTVDPNLRAALTLVTPTPIAREDVLPVFEDALRAANLALVAGSGGYRIVPTGAAASTSEIANSEAVGYATETIQLKFVTAPEMRKLIEPILPGVVDNASQGTQLVIKGATGQRSSVRELVKQFDVNWLRNMSFGLYIPKQTDARLIVPELEKLINGNDAPTKGLVRLIAMEKLNGILAVSIQPQYLEDVQRWVNVLDREGENNEPRLFVYRVQNGRSSDLAKTLIAALGGGKGSGGADSSDTGDDDATQDDQQGYGQQNRFAAADEGSEVENGRRGLQKPKSAAAGVSGTATKLNATITSDDINNAITVFATQRNYAVIEDALRKLDLAPSQILIEAAITEVTLTNDLRYGVQWSFTRGKSDVRLSNQEGTLGSLVREFPGFSYFYAGRSIDATLNALEGLTKINVVAAPKLMVLNNQTASLQVGDQVPIASASAVSTQNPDSPIVNSIQYRDTGVILEITPRVNSNGVVLLDISQEVSDVSTTRTSTLNSPTISTRRVSSSVAVKDGNLIAIGGLIRNRDERGRSGIPFLSRIPVLGSLLFGTTNNTLNRTELVILIKPTVLRSVEDGKAATEEMIEKIRSVQPLLEKSGQRP